MLTVEEGRKMQDFEEEILQLIDNQDEFTRSDLQGSVTALVMKMCRLERAEIIVEISGGCVMKVSGLPENWNYKLVDRDNE